jgi:hypothetical protein
VDGEWKVKFLRILVIDGPILNYRFFGGFSKESRETLTPQKIRNKKIFFPKIHRNPNSKNQRKNKYFLKNNIELRNLNFFVFML